MDEGTERCGMKIAGYTLEFEYFEWGGFDYKTTGPLTVHRQCAWNHEMLGNDEDMISMVKIPLEQAALYACSACGKMLSEPAWFAFQAERIR